MKTRYSLISRVRTFTLPVLLATCLSGCFTPSWQTIPAGASEADVRAKLGPPREIYTLSPGVTRWLYPTQPMGQHTVAADIDAQGRVRDVKEVLTSREFAKAEIGKWTQHDVLVHFGKPVETSYFPLMKREVWTYRFKQDDVWNTLMHFYFSPDGVLRTTQTSPDPLYDPDRRSIF